MDLALTRRGDYAVRAALCLADLVAADAKLEAEGGFSVRGFPPA